MTKIGVTDKSSTEQPKYIRYVSLAPISTIYFKYPAVRERAAQIANKTVNKDTVIKNWFANLALQIHGEIETERIKRLGQTKQFKTGRFYNLHFWSGFSILPTALLLADSPNPAFQSTARKLFIQSNNVFTDAMFEIEFNRDEAGNGFLVRELQRRRLALNYHAYASYPILGMATLSQAYKCDFTSTSWKKKQISRLIKKH